MAEVERRHVGLVIGTEDAFALDFWVYVDPQQYLQLDDVVTVPVTLPDGKPIRLHGIVDIVRSRFEGARFDSDSAAARDQRLPVGVAHAAHVSVTRVEPEIFVAPSPGTQVFKSEGIERDEALYFDQMLARKTAFLAGFSRTGEPVYGNIEFLNGTRGAHANISGISGVATKTSYALFLLYSLFHSNVLGLEAPNTKALIFNVKGEDLLWLDKPNRELTPEATKQYESAGLPVGPFRSVGIWAPVRKQGDLMIPASDTRTDGVTAYAWSLEEFCRERLLRFLFAEGDNETSQLSYLIRLAEEWLTRFQPADGSTLDERLTADDSPTPLRSTRGWIRLGDHVVRDFDSLVEAVKDNIDTFAGGAAPGSRSAFIRRLDDARFTAGHLVRAIQPDKAGHYRINVLGNEAGGHQVSVIDIHNLKDRAKRFVVGVVVRRLLEQKEETGSSRPLVFLVLDELNKYAPREGWSPIKEVLLDIAERGRSLGLILIGAQQTASEIERRVTANAAFRVAGRLDSAEAARAEYGFLTDAARARAAILKPGTMFLHQPEIPVPILTQFPYPAWATRKSEVDHDAPAPGGGSPLLEWR